jgi:CheY-like chemotaxis protein
MEAVGQLAGGVAHDFNNILTAIQGNAELLKLQARPGGEEEELVEQILSSSRRAAELTNQLLTFARRSQFQCVPVNVHQIIRDVQKLLTTGTSHAIDVVVDEKADNAIVNGDPAQLQSALLHLGLNARDAMPDGGRLTFSTRSTTLTDADSRTGEQDLPCGTYVEVSVTDTGLGVPKDVREHVFEPFFTTKPPGQGTGLGLASVYGCVRQHNGGIRLYSEEGRGTTFRLLLPVVHDQSSTSEDVEPVSQGTSGNAAHVLIVDDEEIVRNYAARALRALGYRVTVCADGREGLRTYESARGDIDLVILDLIMPEFSGADVFREMKRIQPDVRVLLSSGFSRSRMADELLNEGAVGFLNKPFGLQEISAQMKRLIAQT